MIINQGVVLLRILLAAIMGGLIGWERESHDRPAGFRTHILVCVGSALVMIVSVSIFFLLQESARVDPGRIAAQVVSGIGFLGAGTIIREGISVKGLTTAASLWAVAGIGLAVGAGLYFSGFITTVIVFISLYFLSQIEFRKGKKGLRELFIRAKDRPGVLGRIGSFFGDRNINIKKISLEESEKKDQVIIYLQVYIAANFDVDELTGELTLLEEIYEISWQS